MRRWFGGVPATLIWAEGARLYGNLDQYVKRPLIRGDLNVIQISVPGGGYTFIT